jgi:beta-galactosidase
LLDVKKYGMENLPLGTKLRMAKCFGKYKMTFADATNLYGKYVGSWGMAATVWRVDAKKDGKVVKSVTCCPSNRLHLEVTPSTTVLHETDTYDMAAVRIRVLNEFGELTPFASLPMELKVEGPAQLVGPEIIAAEGGMCGTYLKTVGQTGTVTLTVTTPGTPAVTVEFEVK